MPTVISIASTHRAMPQDYTCSTSSASSHTSRKSSSPGLSSISRVSGNRSSQLSDNNARFSSYTPTTVSSYRRRIDVEGLPGPTYFSSGQSKVDRRREYVQPPTPPSQVSAARSAPRSSSPRPSHSSARRGLAGKQMVKYRDPYQQAYDSDKEDEAGYGGDEGTLAPGDSISQVSYTPSRSRQGGRRDSVLGLDRRDSAGSSRAESTFSKISTFQSEQVFDGTKRCYLVERRPRASATAVR